jgi:hypothetical protein
MNKKQTWNVRDLATHGTNDEYSLGASLRPKKGEYKLDGNYISHRETDNDKWKIVPMISKSDTKWHLLRFAHSDKFTPIEGTYRIQIGIIIRTAGPYTLRLYNLTTKTTACYGIKYQALGNIPDDENKWAIAELNCSFIADGEDQYCIEAHAIEKHIEYLINMFRLEKVY